MLFLDLKTEMKLEKESNQNQDCLFHYFIKQVLVILLIKIDDNIMYTILEDAGLIQK